MSKPTKLPEWGTGVSAVISEPTKGKKEAGWVFDDMRFSQAGASQVPAEGSD